MRISQKTQNLLFNHRFIFDKTGEKPTSVPAQAEKPDGKKLTEGKMAERKVLADAEAKKNTEKTEEKQETPAGKVHQTYFEKTEAISETDAEKDREKLRANDIKTIRFNSRLLKEKAEKEDESTQALGIKEETQKRIKAYTDKTEKDWYILNYQRLGSDKKGQTHEMNVGLGDILLDPDIKEILVKKADGSVIKAHRGVVAIRQNHAGRQAFLDENNQYVDTYTGDKFRILSNQETDLKDPKSLKKYLEEFSTEEKVRQENKKHFDDEIKTTQDQDAYYTEANLDPNKSIVEQIKIPLSGSQKESARIIEKVFKESLQGKGLSDEAIAKIIAAAIVNSYKESRLNASNRTGDGGHSIGLFQVNDAGGAGAYLLKTMSREESIIYRQNPENNCKIILEREILKGFGKTLLARAKAGASVTELAAIFSRDIERPKDKYGAMQGRAKQALVMFGERTSNTSEEIAERIDNGKEGYNGKGIIKLRSNQDSWIFGSSGAVAMNNLKNGLNLGNTGFFGIVGISPGKFYERLQGTWPKISQLKLPKQVVLVGLAANGLGSNTDTAVQKNIDTYASIKKFLEEKGVKVKIATVQPAAGLGDQISRFNNELRKKYDPDTLIDIAKYTTTEDGKHLNSEYASADGIHMSNKGYQKLAGLIKKGADQEKTA